MGSAKIEGTDTVSGKEVPAIYFGSTKQNNNFALVDDVANETGATATIFVKSDDGFVRARGDDGNRAVGTILDPKGKAIESIRRTKLSMETWIFSESHIAVDTSRSTTPGRT